MAKDYSVLKAKLAEPALSGLSAADQRAALNTKDVPVKRPIPVSKIKAYLQMVGKRLAIIDSPSVAARNAEVSFQDFETFDMTDAAYVSRLNAILDDLITEGLINGTDKAYVLSFGNDLVSWADQNWQGDVSLADIENANNYV